jgi:DNA mismatch endonuclease (patch repair protein)
MSSSGGNPDPRPRTVILGGGVVVPYPEPADAAATKIGKANRRRDTKAEVALRSTLHRRGLRFRKDRLIRCASGVKVRPDVVFTSALVAVFVDGCFWHGCPDHQRIPMRNIDYWVPKLHANVERDRRVDEALTADGWHVERVWEHEDPKSSADRIAAAIAERRPRSRQAKRS